MHISFSQVLNVELLNLLGGGEEGDVNSPQELAEDGGQLLNMLLIMLTKCAIVLGKLPDIGHKHLHELDELLSDETNVLFKSKYNGVNQQIISEYRATFLHSFIFISVVVILDSLEITVVQNQIQQTDDVDLHGLVFLLDAFSECLNQWFDNFVCYFIGFHWIRVLFNLFQDQLHEFTG